MFVCQPHWCALQRGSIYLEDGDPETPEWPSLPGIYRVPEDELRLPAIPAQPIGYDDAEKIFEKSARRF